MKATPRKGSWHKSAPGVYTKPIGAYGSIKFGATARVSFVPFPTCTIIDADGAHIGAPTAADEKKFVAAAKKVYTKDTNVEAARLQKREAVRTAPPKRKTAKRPVDMVQCGEDNLKMLMAAQKLEAEIKNLRGQLKKLGRAPPTTHRNYRAYKATKTRIDNAIKARQVEMRNLLPKKYRTPKQLAAALKKTHEAEASVYRQPFSQAAEHRRDATLAAIAAAYRGN